MLTLAERLHRAQTSQGDELWQMVRDSHPEVVLRAILNRHLTEDMALFIAKKRTAPSEALGLIAGDVRFKDSYKLKLLVCRNPRTPQRIVFTLLKFLRIFDLGDMTRDQTIPVTVRQKIELLLAEKVPALPSGVKSALARRSSSTVVLNLMERGDRNVVADCLDAAVITEAHLCALIRKTDVKPIVVQMIAVHQKWSLRYNVRYALIMNCHTPMMQAARFIPEMKTIDLRDLYSYESLPASARPFIHAELMGRHEDAGISQAITYEITEDDSDDFIGRS